MINLLRSAIAISPQSQSTTTRRPGWTTAIIAGAFTLAFLSACGSDTADADPPLRDTPPTTATSSAPPSTAPAATTTTFRAATSPKATGRKQGGATTPASVYYRNCAEVKAAGKAPLRRGEPGYREALDSDKDGEACES